MPPSIPRCSLGSLSRSQTNVSAASSSRTFSSSASLAKIGPESPRFIELPKAVQPFPYRPREVKGVLPVPRSLFPRRAGDKTTSSYLAFATLEPHTKKALQDSDDTYVNWKRRLAANRRDNLREGLTSLSRRDNSIKTGIARRSQAKQDDREKRLYAPQREDERLTTPTILASTRTYIKGALPDPQREERILASKQAVAAKAQDLADERADALHTLYMHARNFITTEAQLDAKVEELFTELPFFNTPGTLYRDATNIWDAKGAPPSASDLMAQITKSERTVLEFRRSPAAKTAKRMARLAEELTGGKMD